MSILDFNENTFNKQASRMNENRKACGLPTSIPLCMRIMVPDCELTESQIKTLIKTISKF